MPANAGDNGRVTDDEETGLDNLEWVVWTILCRDPRQRLSAGMVDDLGETVRDMATSLGCDYLGVAVDLLEAPDGLLFQWMVRITRSDHSNRDEGGTPTVVASLHAHLQSRVPKDGHDIQWTVAPDLKFSEQLADRDLLRRAYESDLLAPLEGQLLLLRQDGAEDVDPQPRRIYSSKGATRTVIGIYQAELFDYLDGSRLVVRAGLQLAESFWLDHGFNDPAMFRTPVLVVPRPEIGTTSAWVAELDTSSSFSGPALSTPDRSSSRTYYRWESQTPSGHLLADRVTADLRTLRHRLGDFRRGR